MQGMSNHKGGNYYFVSEVKRVDECFVDCLATVTTALAESGMVRLTFKESKNGAKIKVIEALGENIKKISENVIEARILTIYAGIKKDFLFECEYIPGDKTDQPAFIYVDMHFEFNKLGDQQLTVVNKSFQVQITGKQEKAAGQEPGGDIESNLLRLQVVDVLKALQSQMNNKSLAMTLVKGLQAQIKEHEAPADNQMVSSIRQVVDHIGQMLEDDKMSQKLGYSLQNYLVQQINTFSNQSSCPMFDNTGLFSTSKQTANLQAARKNAH